MKLQLSEEERSFFFCFHSLIYVYKIYSCRCPWKFIPLFERFFYRLGFVFPIVPIVQIKFSRYLTLFRCRTKIDGYIRKGRRNVERILRNWIMTSPLAKNYDPRTFIHQTFMLLSVENIYDYNFKNIFVLFLY